MQDRCYQVSELTGKLKVLLENHFSRITVMGEISNFRPSSTGHWYFSLKDDDALLSAVMFKNRLGMTDFTPEDGMLVQAQGSISVYAKRGNYQLICEELEMAGRGNILAMLEKKKQEFVLKGYFSAEHKKPLPPYPARVAVITSPTGAALQDILRVLGRRNAGVDLVILPAPVQGDQAAGAIARQLRIANLHKLGEVVILARGGGSLEDLLPFFAEEVVSAIHDSALPVISAIGHETDICFADLAADRRAATPSAAAEMVVVSTNELLQRIETLAKRMSSCIEKKVQHIRLLVSQFKPDNIERNFRIFIQPLILQCDDLKEALFRNLRERVKENQHRLEVVSRRLEANSPFEILKRGYAVVSRAGSSSSLLRAEDVNPGDKLEIRLHQGRLKAEVKEKEV